MERFQYSCAPGFELTKPYPTDACWDIRSTEEVIFRTHELQEAGAHIPPLRKKTVGTTITLALKPGWEGRIRARSGLANLGLAVHPGTIDASYRGEIKLILTYHGDGELRIKKGDRVAQLAIREVPAVELELVEFVADDTPRGTHGLGSSGVS